jgi:hypothetical protein
MQTPPQSITLAIWHYCRPTEEQITNKSFYIATCPSINNGGFI